MGAVIDAIEDGHLISAAQEDGTPKPGAECKSCKTAWPCEVIRFARSKDNDKADRRVKR